MSKYSASPQPPVVPTRQRRWRHWRLFSFWAALALAIALLLSPNVPWPELARAQTPLTQQLTDNLPDLFAGDRTESDEATDWVRLDGRPLFRVVADADELPRRVDEIERNLWQASRDYIRDRSEELLVEVRENQALPTIYVNEFYILTVTHLDADLYQVEPITRAQMLEASLVKALETAKQERQPTYLRRQAAKAIGLVAIASLASVLLRRLQRYWQNRNRASAAAAAAVSHPETIDLSRPPNSGDANAEGSAAQHIATNLTQKQRSNIKAVRRLLFQLAQVLLWAGALLALLSLFPQTRPVQVWWLSRMQAHAVAVVIAIATYIAIRLSYALVDRIIEALLDSAQLVRRGPRLHQRVSTVSGVTKGIVTVLLIIAGSLAALSSLGADIGPLIAGAGLVGVAISLASQNIIRDAINGFLVLAEDQYAVGDVIVVGEVFGLVQRITLRMTQLRDPEERLITIPNSEIKVVCNLTSHHSQADLQIPVAYSADIDQAFKIIEDICEQMKTEPGWRELILQEPNILGLDDFSDRGMVIRIWIRTPPLKHWDVAREFRRRTKRAFDAAGIALARNQQELWLRSSDRDRMFASGWADGAGNGRDN